MRCPEDIRSDDLATRFVISGGTVMMPVGAFLLVRKSGHIGAIRVISINPANTDYLGKTSYESYFQPDGSGSLVARNVVRQTGELNLQSSKGPGRGVYTYRPGPFKAQVGDWKFAFNTTSVMDMSDSSFWTGVGDHGYEFAPTSACDITEVDAHDKRLKWFRFDRNASVLLPLAELPK
jgi:hypothetical protein